MNPFYYLVPRQLQVARLIQAVVNSVPANADVHVEINQNPRNHESHIEIQHAAPPQQLQQQQQTQASQQHSTTTGSSNTSSPGEPGKQILLEVYKF